MLKLRTLSINMINNEKSPIKLEKIFAIIILGNYFYSKYIKNFYKSIRKRHSIKQYSEELPQKDIQIANKHIKKCPSSLSHQGIANKNHNDISISHLLEGLSL